MNISFKGREEVIYALESAAARAKELEYTRSSSIGPRAVFHGEQESLLEGEMRAYLDMACKDELFLNTIQRMQTKEKENISKELAKKQLQYYLLNPMEQFAETIREKFLVHHDKSEIKILEKFLKQLNK